VTLPRFPEEVTMSADVRPSPASVYEADLRIIAAEQALNAIRRD
jgi:hypothetical protein